MDDNSEAEVTVLEEARALLAIAEHYHPLLSPEPVLPPVEIS